MLSKILCLWGALSIIFCVWNRFPGPVLGLYLSEGFFLVYLCLTIALFSFTLAYLVYRRDD